MIEEQVSNLRIHQLTKQQYEKAETENRLERNSIYLVPEEPLDLSPYLKFSEAASMFETKYEADVTKEKVEQNKTDLLTKVGIDNDETINGQKMFKKKIYGYFSAGGINSKDQSIPANSYFVIRITNKSHWMLAFTARVYQQYNYTDIVISGYNYRSTKTWHLPKAVMVGSSQKGPTTVYFGNEEDNALWVAIPATGYSGLEIFNVLSTGFDEPYSDKIENFSNLFQVTYESTLPYTKTQLDPQTIYPPVYDSANGIAANSATRLSSSAGSVFEPVYFPSSTGLPTKCSSPQGIVDLTQTTRGNIFTENPNLGVQGVLSLANGGTGANNAATALQNLGITINANNINLLPRLTSSLIAQGTKISTKNIDLNNQKYIKIGHYYCNSNDIAATLVNCPTKSAFKMEVINPLSSEIDNEGTKAYLARIRILKEYYTGLEYIQTISTSADPKAFNYGSWYVVPRIQLTNNEGQYEKTLGNQGKPIYIDASGNFQEINILDVACGGTGAISFTENRLLNYDNTNKKLLSTSHFVSNDKLAINSTSNPDSNLYVGGSTKLDGALVATGAVEITNIADSTSSSTGALRVSGGAYITKSFIVGGATTLTGAAILNNSLIVDGATTLNDSLTVKENASLEKTLNVTGITTLGAPNTSANTVELTVNGQSSLNGNVVISGTLNTANAVTLSNNLTVNGNTTLGNAATDSIIVNGSTTINDHLKITKDTDSTSSTTGALQIAGGAYITKQLRVGSSLTVTGSTILNNELTVAEATTLNKTLLVKDNVTLGDATTDTVTITGPTSIGGTLGVIGATTLSSTLGVAGATTLSSTLGVTGATTLSDNLTVKGNTTLGDAATDTVTITGVTKITNPTNSTSSTTGALQVAGGVYIGNELRINGATTATGAVTLNNTLTVAEATDLNGALSVKGNVTLGDATTDTVTIKGSTSIENTLTIGTSGTTATTNKLTVNGQSSFAGNVAISGTLSTTGATTLSSNLTVNGDVTLGDAATDNVIVNGSTTINDHLKITEDTDSTSSTTGSLQVAGGAYITKQLRVGSSLTVTGATTLNNDLTVSGNTTLGTAGTDTTTATTTTVQGSFIKANGHIYLDGASTMSTTNTTQIIFRQGTLEHIALSSNDDCFVINPSSLSSDKQIALYLGTKSSSLSTLPSKLSAAGFITSGAISGGSLSVTGAISGGSLTITGATTLKGNATFGDAQADTITIAGRAILKSGITYGSAAPENVYNSATAATTPTVGQIYFKIIS